MTLDGLMAYRGKKVSVDADAFAAFARRLLDPDDLGWAATAEIRSAARMLLLPHGQPERRAIYIAGPMSGIESFNHDEFRAAELRLEEAGYWPINPARNGLPPTSPWEHHMRRDIGMLIGCSGIATLPGWESSRGASLEVNIATALAMPVCSVDAWVEKINDMEDR
ncbi:MAG: DUF4406 domain-containing protein [Fimbriimonadales bacterium]